MHPPHDAPHHRSGDEAVLGETLRADEHPEHHGHEQLGRPVTHRARVLGSAQEVGRGDIDAGLRQAHPRAERGPSLGSSTVEQNGLRLALVGCGAAAGLHLPAIEAAPRTVVTAAIDTEVRGVLAMYRSAESRRWEVV